VADEIVDDPDGPPTEQRTDLERIRDAVLTGDTDESVLAAFAELRDRIGIDDSEVDTFVDAMVTDVEKRRYATYDELAAYMRGSSVAVANMMLAVMAPDDPETARPHAAALGEAFQLTNFLRDVREDLHDRDRIYVPKTTLDAHGVTEDQLRAGAVDDGVRAAVAAELKRTEALYREGVAGIQYLPRDCQFPVLLAAVLYAEHHRLIRSRDYDVLTETPQLSLPRKLWLLARTRWHWWRTGDPVAVFERVSAVPAAGEHGVQVPRVDHPTPT
jgi:phytoene synthase